MSEECKKILVVDDEELVINLIKHCLERLNEKNCPQKCSISVSTSGIDAIEIMRKNKPDLIILDMIMPKINGLDILRIIKADENLKDIKTIVLSSTDDYMEECKKLGIDEYLLKPIKVTLIFEKIQQLLLCQEK
ncbi:MAG TPA: response regulator [bacterium]|nr:response regulator [bacterium]